MGQVVTFHNFFQSISLTSRWLVGGNFSLNYYDFVDDQTSQRASQPDPSTAAACLPLVAPRLVQGEGAQLQPA